MFEFLNDWGVDLFGDSFAIGPRRRAELSPEERKEAAECLVHELAATVRYLQGTAQVVFGPNILAHSDTLLLTYGQSPRICAVQTRPIAECYQRVGAPVPSSENPDAPSAPGLELIAEFGVDYSTAPPGRSFFIEVRLSITGSKQREAFKRIFYSHQRTVEILVGLERLTLSTESEFQRVDAYRGNNIRGLLDRFFSKQEETASLALSAEFSSGADPARVIRSYLVLMAFYDACYHSCNRSLKGRDLLPKHLERIHHR
jgi:hypothetical protein